MQLVCFSCELNQCHRKQLDLFSKYLTTGRMKCTNIALLFGALESYKVTCSEVFDISWPQRDNKRPGQLCREAITPPNKNCQRQLPFFEILPTGLSRRQRGEIIWKKTNHKKETAKDDASGNFVVTCRPGIKTIHRKAQCHRHNSKLFKFHLNCVGFRRNIFHLLFYWKIWVVFELCRV